MERTLPRPTATSAHYWTGCAEGVLRLQHCGRCQQYQFYPRVMCSHCGAGELNWREASGRGRIASYTVVEWASPMPIPVPMPSSWSIS